MSGKANKMTNSKKHSLAYQEQRSGVIALVLAGLVSAAATLTYLPVHITEATAVEKSNPVLTRALKRMRKLQANGQWKAAAQEIQQFATPDNPEALLEYGKLLAKGWGVARDLDEAREKLLLAVQQDFPKRGQAAFELAKVYRQSSGKDCARIAFEWFAKSANWGFQKAHVELGRHHARGIGVPVNLTAALSEFKIASEYGSARAMISFLRMISQHPELGNDLPPLRELVNNALPAIKQEALAGKAASAKVLGRLYLDNALLDQNKAKARYWLQKSSDLGDSGAMVELALLTVDGLPSQTDVQSALKWMNRAIALKNPAAYTELGRLHLTGKFGLKPKGAPAFFAKGMNAAHPGSMLELGRLHLSGKLVAKSESRGRELLQRSAALGHEGAKRLLQQFDGEKPPTVKVRADLKIDPQSLRLPVQPVAKKQTKPKTFQHPLNGATVITPFGTRG